MESRLTTEIACLAVVAGLAKQMKSIEGRIRLQKTLYLLKQAGVQELEHTEFAYHYYGPFARIAAEAVESGVEEGVLHEDRSVRKDDQQERVYFRYRPGPNVDEYASDVSHRSLELIGKIGPLAKDADWRALELAATIHFVQKAESLTRESACKRALALKPACSTHARSALDLLDRMGL